MLGPHGDEMGWDEDRNENPIGRGSHGGNPAATEQTN